MLHNNKKIDISFLLQKTYAYLLCNYRCVSCGKQTFSTLTICETCIKKYFDSFFNKQNMNTSSFCNKCGKELISEIETCMRCKRNNFLFFKNFSLFPYMGLGTRVVADWKNKGLRTYSKFFTQYILRFLETRSELHNLQIIPVPARPKKIKEKGWDQVNDIANELRFYGIHILKCLKRHDGISQKKASREERKTNLSGKFYLNEKYRDQLPDTVLLLDDIITTGATINECTKVLLEAGCKKVYSLALFFD